LLDRDDVGGFTKRLFLRGTFKHDGRAHGFKPPALFSLPREREGFQLNATLTADSGNSCPKQR